MSLDTSSPHGGAELEETGSFPGTYRAGIWLNVTVTVWFGDATLPAVQEMARFTRRSVKTINYPRISAIHLVPEHMAMPHTAVRKTLLQIMTEHADRFGCVAAIVGGTGFWSSALRSFITGMRVLAPRTFDLRVYGALEELVEWFPAEHYKRTGIRVDVASLTRVVEQGMAWQVDGLARRAADGGTSS